MVGLNKMEIREVPVPEPKAGEVLVKVLVNEQEKLLGGLTPVEGCYYRWSDVKSMIENL